MKRLFLSVSIALTFVLLTTDYHSSTRAQEKGNAMKEIVRMPAVAGQFYPKDPVVLKNDIAKYLDSAKPEPIKGKIIAVISPHAGYIYSGWVAAYGYKLLKGKHYKNVVVVSPSHAEYFDYSSIFPGKAYMTPLGEITINQKLVEAIASRSEHIKEDGRGHLFAPYHRGEHALEVQLPFLQETIEKFELVPVVMGDQSRENVFALGDALGEALKGQDVLLVASTDLSHFYTDEKAKQLDSVFMKLLEEFDPEKLYDALASKSTEACGGGPTVAVMIAAKKLGANRCIVLHYANSGDVTGDKSNVVGYTSAVMIKEDLDESTDDDSAGENKEGTSSSDDALSVSPGSNNNKIFESNKESKDAFDIGLTREDKIFLLKLARETITEEVNGRKMKIPPAPSPIMNEPRGAFVTLHKHGALRGCIGYIEPVKPLIETIVDMAKAAAFDDWRFPPVEKSEVPELDIEISILSPIQEIKDPSKIIVGKHGIIITRGMNRGLLLPQVATEWGWDREKFLEETCIKAGLPKDTWKQKGTKIEIFSSEIFSEKEMGLK